MRRDIPAGGAEGQIRVDAKERLECSRRAAPERPGLLIFLNF
jgi:hypothetical protein